MKILGNICKRGHDHEGTGQSLRYASGCCVMCSKEKYLALDDSQKARRSETTARCHAKNRESCRKAQAKYRKNPINKSKAADTARKWRSGNKVHLAESSKKFRASNPQKMKAYEKKRSRPASFKISQSLYIRNYRIANPDRVQVWYNRRRARLAIRNTLTPNELKKSQGSRWTLLLLCL